MRTNANALHDHVVASCTLKKQSIVTAPADNTRGIDHLGRALYECEGLQ